VNPGSTGSVIGYELRRLVQIGIAAAALAGTGCGGDDSGSGGNSPTAGSGGGSANGKSQLAANAKPANPGLTIKTLASQYGKVLFSKSNRAIYYFDKESSRTPKCYGSCAKAWPPVLTSGKPQVGGAVKSALLGTTQRENGKKQVTYDGRPLYFYVTDPRGEVECHNIEEFGGLWLAVKPSGKPAPVS
jgi:predicted lipoprotein with Yx(FWY)xxD motif